MLVSFHNPLLVSNHGNVLLVYTTFSCIHRSSHVSALFSGWKFLTSNRFSKFMLHETRTSTVVVRTMRSQPLTIGNSSADEQTIGNNKYSLFLKLFFSGCNFKKVQIFSKIISPQSLITEFSFKIMRPNLFIRRKSAADKQSS